jgi:F-type H+-transporting ATPase subunit alpha
LTEILKQPDFSPLPFEFQVILIYAATNGYLDDIKLEKVSEFESRFIEYLEKLHKKDILTPLKEKGELDTNLEEKIKNILVEFKDKILLE